MRLEILRSNRTDVALTGSKKRFLVEVCGTEDSAAFQGFLLECQVTGGNADVNGSKATRTTASCRRMACEEPKIVADFDVVPLTAGRLTATFSVLRGGVCEPVSVEFEVLSNQRDHRPVCRNGSSRRMH